MSDRTGIAVELYAFEIEVASVEVGSDAHGAHNDGTCAVSGGFAVELETLGDIKSRVQASSDGVGRTGHLEEHHCAVLHALLKGCDGADFHGRRCVGHGPCVHFTAARAGIAEGDDIFGGRSESFDRGRSGGDLVGFQLTGGGLIGACNSVFDVGDILEVGDFGGPFHADGFRRTGGDFEI